MDVMVMTKAVKVVHDPSKMPVTVILAALNEAGLQASLGKRGKSSGWYLLLAYGIRGEYQVYTVIVAFVIGNVMSVTIAVLVYSLGIATSTPWHVILSGICLGIALLSVVVPSLSYLEWAALGAVFFGCPFILRRAYTALKQLHLDINILMILSTIGAIAISEYIEAGSIVFLFGFSEWLEDKCMGRARESIGFLMEMQPEIALSAVTNEVVPIDQVSPARKIGYLKSCICKLSYIKVCKRFKSQRVNSHA